jgi:hypothetical protein
MADEYLVVNESLAIARFNVSKFLQPTWDILSLLEESAFESKVQST